MRAAAFAAPFGREPYGATSCRTASPAPAATSPAVTPDDAPHEQDQAVTLVPSAPIIV